MGTMSGSSMSTFDIGSIEFYVISLIDWLIATILTESNELFFLSILDWLIDIVWLSSHVVPLLHRLIQLLFCNLFSQ